MKTQYRRPPAPNAASSFDFDEKLERLSFISNCLPGLAYERRVPHGGSASYPYFAGALLKQFGLTADRVEKNPRLLFDRIHPGDQDKFRLTVEAATRSSSGYGLDLRWIDNAGQIVWTRNLAIAKEHADGPRWMCLSVDVTELKASQAAVKTAQSERPQFMANISHELRTPLHGLLGYNELLLTTELSVKQRRYVELANEASQSLLHIANEALEYGQASHQRPEKRSEVFDLHERLLSIFRAFEPDAAKKYLGFSILLSPDLPTRVMGDAQRLRQILTNIVSNAIKYTDIGNVEIHCEAIGGGEFGTRIQIEIRDTGIGIAQDLVPELFGRFSQVSRNSMRKQGGSGLGLSIAKAHLEELGGTIGVETREGFGTTVRIELALQPTTMAEIEPYTRAALPSKTVLVVDDTPSNTDLVREFLHGTPVLVRTAENGQKALEFIANQGADLIFMDLNMPVMDGIEATRRIRALSGGRGKMPIIALTGEVSPGAREQCRSSGFDDFVAKPFNRARLEGMISKWC